MSEPLACLSGRSPTSFRKIESARPFSQRSNRRSGDLYVFFGIVDTTHNREMADIKMALSFRRHPLGNRLLYFALLADLALIRRGAACAQATHPILKARRKWLNYETTPLLLERI